MSKSENTPENELQFEWMVRPCDIYREEYRDCKSIKARFHQYFVYGETIDCTQWKTDYNNCYLWENYKSRGAFADLIESERTRRLRRLKGHYENNVWQKRDKPPENWNAPLPQWIDEKNKNSYFKCISEKLKETSAEEVEKSSCTIM